MGNPISGISPVIQQAPTQVADTEGGGPTQSPVQAPQEAPTKGGGPKERLWPPAYGYRFGAVEGRHTQGHNEWQGAWIGGQMDVATGSTSVHDVKDAIGDLLSGPGKGNADGIGRGNGNGRGRGRG